MFLYHFPYATKYLKTDKEKDRSRVKKKSYLWGNNIFSSSKYSFSDIILMLKDSDNGV